jgi:hypothetical protein
VVVVAGDTVTMTVLEEEAARFEVPPKLAVIEFAPVGSVVRFNVLTPLMTTPVPMDEAPSRKVITPLVAGVPPMLTVAVKVTPEPKVGFVEEELSTVVVAQGATVTMTALEIEAAKFDVPP